MLSHYHDKVQALKKLLRILAVLIVVGFVIGTEQLPVRGWLIQKLETLALRHADKLPLATIGGYLFNKNCAQCHDDPEMKAPTREALSSISKEYLMISMEFGKMQPMAAQLGKRQRGLIAFYLAGDTKDQYQWIAQAQCAQPAGTDRRPIVTNWGLGPENRRFVDNQLAGINAGNVASLKLNVRYK